MINYNFLRGLREKKGLSQDYIAQGIGISRQTYIEIEKGKSELSISQAQDLAHIFKITLEELVSGKIQKEIEVVFENSDQEEGSKKDIRISVPQKNLKKFKEVLLYILEKVGGKPNVGESVLNKLLYFIDFDYYEKFEEQLIGATYIRNHYGPTPCEMKKVIENMKTSGELTEIISKHFQFDQKKYLPLRKPNLGLLSAQELEHIDAVLNRLSDKSAKEICDYSHEDIPWKIHKEGEKIDYESVFYRDDNYSVRDYGDKL